MDGYGCHIAEDFGPLPKDLSDFESIILNTQDDGTRLPEDGVSEDIEDIMELEAPEGDIRLTEVGVGWKEHIVKSSETLSAGRGVSREWSAVGLVRL